MKKFTTPLQVQVNYDKPERTLISPLVFVSDILGTLIVPAGFDTDYATTPRFTWIFYPPHDIYAPAAVVHDMLYRSKICTREEADSVFLEAMVDLGVDTFRRRSMWLGVRLFGGFGYGRGKG